MAIIRSTMLAALSVSALTGCLVSGGGGYWVQGGGGGAVVQQQPVTQTVVAQPDTQMQVQTDVHYPTPDYRQPCLRGKIDDSPLPHTEADARRVMTLPCFPELTDAEVDAVIAACNRL